MDSSQTPADYDIFVIGGGVNGCGIARDASGRGYSVMLAEMGDLASGTSSAATKLVHGGLRYLEHYEFRLVHESLAEREVLWALAPHIIWPLRFVLPHHQGLRPAFVLRAGLLVYDNLGARKLLPRSRTIDLSSDPAGTPLRPEYRKAFEYSDCWVDDARLVVLNARDAADRGAAIRTRARVTAAHRQNGRWTIRVEDVLTGTAETVTARMLVNAAGPWVDAVLQQALGMNEAHHVRLVKGSHIVVNQLFDHDKAYIFQNKDGRIVFAIPYEGRFTLIGTTDEDFAGDPHEVAIDAAETQYLLGAASEYFKRAVTDDEIVWSYSGVRPLMDDGASAAQEATRDYVLKVDGDAETGAVLNVFGGKLTTYRRLAESALKHIEAVLGARGPAWTKTGALPGGDFPPQGFDLEVEKLARDKPGLPRRMIKRLIRHYGTLARTILGTATSLADMGPRFGSDLTGQEVRYLMDREWAVAVEDVLWRRSKLGLTMARDDVEKLDAFMRSVRGQVAA